MKSEQIKKMVVLAVLAALAYVVMVFIRVPVILFLKYEPKDVIITIAGFMYGPLASVLISLVVSSIEAVTVSDTGWIGAVMNFVSTRAFVLPATFIYKYKHNLAGAIFGLVIGWIASLLYVPIIQIAYSAADRALPLQLITKGTDVARLIIIILIMFAICMGILINQVYRMKISQALKLGED